MECCEVCCERLNNSNHKKVECPFCDLISCRACNQKYLLSTTEEPHCMKCKHEYNREFVDNYCSSIFRNRDYRRHREYILLQRELARMPETQPYVVRELEKRSLRVSYLYMVYILTNLRNHSNEISPNVIPHLDGILRECIVDIYETLRVLTSTEPTLEGDAYHKIAQKCPSENCRGFLCEDWKCGICKHVFCEKCHCALESNHKCNKDTVKTIKLLKRDTKPCPKCNVPISKIEGCAQMWCTQCHVAFDWRTGRLETGRIHNPHYFEFKKRSREHGDIPCGGRPTHTELKNIKASRNILNVSLEVIHLEYLLIYRYAFIYEDNRHLRMRYLLKEISEEHLKRELQRRDKSNAKVYDIRDILQLYIDTVGDLLRQYVINKDEENNILNEIREITAYTNAVFERIRKRYICRTPHNIILITIR
jgi:hypothetical protein